MLTLRVVKGRASGASRAVDKMGIVVGRGSACDWILPDPERVLSSRHFRVDVVDGRYLLTDTSSNGVFHNRAATAVGRDGTVVLSDGDVLSLGEYEIAVSVGASPSVVDTWTDVSSAPLEDPFGLNGPPRTFDEPTPSPATEPDHVPLHNAFFTPPSIVSPPRPAVDPFVPPPASGSGAALAEALPDDWFLGLDAAAPASRPVRETASAPIPVPPREVPRAPAAFEPTRPATDPGPSSPAETPPPPPPAPPVETSPPVSRAASVATPTTDAAGAIAAFLKGAGLPADTMDDLDSVETMRTAGVIFRGLIEGLSGLMTTRSEMKNEFRIERTLIASRNNNPLKFSLDAGETARWLLEPVRPGFLPAEEAVRQGVRDLRRHELAVGVGMRSALDALLRRFDPEAIKAGDDKASALDKVIPSARPARWWEAYEKFYATIEAESEDDFQSIFARDFARAYEAQMKALSEADFKEDEKSES